MHPFATEDGLGLNLTRFRRAACDDVVLLVHGLTSSSDMFIMPEHRNLVSYLLDDGFTDVWALDFRMSNRFPYDSETHRYTLDDIADYDSPGRAARAAQAHRGPPGARHRALPRLAVVHDEPVRRPAARHRQRDLQQRRADPARAGLVTGEAQVRAAADGVPRRNLVPGSPLRQQPGADPGLGDGPADRPGSPRVRRQRLPHAQLHVGQRPPGHVRARQPAARHPRADGRLVQLLRAQLLPARGQDGAGRARGASTTPATRAIATCPTTTWPGRLR